MRVLFYYFATRYQQAVYCSGILLVWFSYPFSFGDAPCGGECLSRTFFFCPKGSFVLSRSPYSLAIIMDRFSLFIPHLLNTPMFGHAHLLIKQSFRGIRYRDEFEKMAPRQCLRQHRKHFTIVVNTRHFHHSCKGGIGVAFPIAGCQSLRQCRKNPLTVGRICLVIHILDNIFAHFPERHAGMGVNIDGDLHSGIINNCSHAVIKVVANRSDKACVNNSFGFRFQSGHLVFNILTICHLYFVLMIKDFNVFRRQRYAKTAHLSRVL